MKYFKNLLVTSLIFSTLILLGSCKNKTEKKDITTVDSDSISLQMKLEEAKEIFYSLPAPHEVATFLIQNNKTHFDKDILNKSNVDKYTSENAQAYNLGIYSADLSYASLFEQNQTVIDYMLKVKGLSEQLGILGAYNDEMISKLEKNVNNRDEIMRIISESFMDSDAYLQENDRHELGAMILIGGWIEGLYIAQELSNQDTNKNIPLVSSILEQQLSLELIVNFLQDFKKTKSLDIVKSDLSDLFKIYQSLSTDVTNEGYLVVSTDEFINLCQKIKEIRNKLINLS